ncbi:hypothetical protein JCM3774_002764 [Rhodotorula dairenensis]
MSDYGDDDLDWADPHVLAELESLESNVTAPPPPPPHPRPRSTATTAGAGRAAAPVKVKAEQPALPRASQLPLKPVPVLVAASRAGGPPARATTPAGPSASQYGNARPGGILRPPRPPQRAAKPAPLAAAARPPALKHDLASRPESSLHNNNDDDHEEDLPEIRLNERHAAAELGDGGGGAAGAAIGFMYRAEPQRGTTIARPAPPPPPAAAAAAAPPPPVPPAPTSPVSRPASLANSPPTTRIEGNTAGGSGLSAQERAELEALRREKAQMKEQLDAAAKKAKELEADVQRRAGENFIIRTRHNKIEMAHQQKLEVERRDKQQLVEQIKAKEREYQRALSSMHTDKSFRQIEVESSGGRGASSAASRRTYTRHHPPSSAHGPKVSSQQQLRGPSAAPESPTANRRVPPQAVRVTRASTEQPLGGRAPPPPPGPLFANFQNSFAPAAPAKQRGESVLPPLPAAPTTSESEREGSMGPPLMPVGGGGGGSGGKGKVSASKRHAPATPPAAAPAAKRSRDGDMTAPKGAPSPQRNGDGVDGLAAREPEEEEELQEDDDAWPWAWVSEDRDTRADLLAAVFVHVTLGPVDMTPAVVQNPHAGTQSVSGRTGVTMRASTARSGVVAATAATARSSARQRTQGRNSSETRSAPAGSASSGVASQPTIYVLTSMRFPPLTGPSLVSRYEELSRDLFALLGHRSPVATSSAYGAGSDTAQRVHELVCRQDPEAGPLAFHLATIFASMLHVLEAATLTGPMTALLKLVSHLAFLCPPFAMACCGAEAIGSVPTSHSSTQKKAGTGSDCAIAPSALISLVGHIVARYCRPATPDPDSLSAIGRNALAGSAVLRTRRPRVTRSLGGRRTSNTANHNGAGGKKGGSDLPRIENLDPAKRVELTASALSLLENVAWRCLAVQPPASTALVSPVDIDVDLATRIAEDAFADLLTTRFAIATLFDPLHSADLLLLGTRFLSMLACRKALFYKILGVKFYELEDVRTSRLAIFDRIATLLAAKREDTDSAYNLDLALLTLANLLAMARDDAVLLVAGSDTFVSELLGKIWQDVRILWEWDGRSVLAGSRERMRLNRRVHRLSRSVKLFYYMSLAPHTHAKLSILDLIAGSASLAPQLSIDGAAGGPGAKEVAAGTSTTRQRRNAYQRQAAHDTLMTSFGTLAFATMGASEGIPRGVGPEKIVDESSMPSWAEPGSKERRTLIELGYMAQEMLEDNSPDELDEIEVCFGGLDDLSEDGEASDDDEEELEISEARPSNGEVERMQLD